jgi:hypothetical protein
MSDLESRNRSDSSGSSPSAPLGRGAIAARTRFRTPRLWVLVLSPILILGSGVAQSQARFDDDKKPAPVAPAASDSPETAKAKKDAEKAAASEEARDEIAKEAQKKRKDREALERLKDSEAKKAARRAPTRRGNPAMARNQAAMNRMMRDQMMRMQRQQAAAMARVGVAVAVPRMLATPRPMAFPPGFPARQPGMRGMNQAVPGGWFQSQTFPGPNGGAQWSTWGFQNFGP